MGRYARAIVALILSPFFSTKLNVWATSLFVECLAYDTQLYLRELLGLDRLLRYWIFGSFLLSFMLFDRALLRAAEAVGERSSKTTAIFMIINSPKTDVIRPHPKPETDLQATRLAKPRLPVPLANLGSLSEEMEEAFREIAKANQDTATASISTPHTQCSNTTPADSLLGSWLEGPPLSPDSPSILDQLWQNYTPKKTRRGDFSWRFSPMKEPADFERLKKQWWGTKPATPRATMPLRQRNSESEDQFTDMILSPSFGSADEFTDMVLAPSSGSADAFTDMILSPSSRSADQFTDMILSPSSGSARSSRKQKREGLARRSEVAERAFLRRLRPEPFR